MGIITVHHFPTKIQHRRALLSLIRRVFTPCHIGSIRDSPFLNERFVIKVIAGSALSVRGLVRRVIN